MKRKLLTLAAALTTSIAFSQSIPNGNFENWTLNTYESPQYFMCANDENADKSSNPPPSVTKTTDAYHGTYAIRMSSSLVGTDSIQAWMANGNPNGWTGGIPYSQTPTGIRLYYKTTLAANDSAIMFMIFKKNNAVIGQYFYKIGANTSSYTLFSKTFSPALPQTPDTLIFACASSDLMNHKAYPGSMFQVDSISFTGASQPSNFNGDLELWQNTTNYKCVGWHGKGAIQTTDIYKGTYALELVTNPPGFGDNQVRVGYVTTGKEQNNGGPPLGGLPYTTQVDTLEFYYKYLPANYPLSTDSARVSLSFYKNGVNIFGFQQKLGASLTYKKVSFPFNLAQVPDTVQLSAESSNWPANLSYVGSDLKIDQVYFRSQVIPVSAFIMPSTGCKSVPIQLTDSSSNGPTSWQWFMTGASPSNSTVQNPVITYTTTGTFTVSLQAADSFGTGAFISHTITINNNPVVTASSATVCAGNTATLTASGASTYTWNTGATGATFTVAPTISTTFSVTGTSTVGCSNASTASVIVPTPVTPAICMVTVDSLSDNNIVYWDKTLYNNVDSFLVYREVSTNTYIQIGAVAMSAMSQLKDTMRLIGPANGDPQIGSYRYKLQIRDTCGAYGVMSPYHNTVKITDQQNGNFQWNTYDVEGQATPVANFILERDNANNGVWSVVGIVSGTQTSLFDGSYGTYQTIANWRVQATGFNCTPTAKYGNNTVQGAVVKSKSNITNNRTTGVSESKPQLAVYPNPGTGNINIQSNKEIGQVTIYNQLGETVYKAYISGPNGQIDLSAQPAGIYTLRQGGTFTKLVKE